MVSRVKNKKAVRFLGEHIVNLVIAVIVLVFLIYLVVKVYTLFVDDSKLKKAEAQLDKLSEVINKVYSEELESKAEFFNIESGWFLKSFFNVVPPENECKGNLGCLCFCSNARCNELKKCVGFDFSVEMQEKYYQYGPALTIGAGGPAATYSESLELINPLYEFKVIKEDDRIKIKVENK